MSALPIEHTDMPTQMSAAELRGPAYEWALWSTRMRLVTSDPHALASAKRIVDSELARVELAASRFRPNSEIRTLPTGRTVRISPTLAAILSSALWAARETDGAVDPTLGRSLEALGYDRDIADLRRLGTVREATTGGQSYTAAIVPRTPWRLVELDVDAMTVNVPDGVLLDLGATAKAWAADACAREVALQLGVGVLVSLGGDIATAGPIGSAGSGGWEVLVHDQPHDPGALVAVPTGLAIATSSTASREWRLGGQLMHHILDPRTAAPVERVWRTATVVAGDCVQANTWATAALVAGRDAPGMLEDQGLPARLVAAGGTVRFVSDWPDDAEVDAAG